METFAERFAIAWQGTGNPFPPECLVEFELDEPALFSAGYGWAYSDGALWQDEFGEPGDSDVDIYLLEPDGTVGSCWSGASSYNGFFSSDSVDSDSNYEIYTAKDKVMAGLYLYIVNYYEDGPMDDAADVYLFSMDPLEGIINWEPLPDFTTGSTVKTMHLQNPAPDKWGDAEIELLLQGYYSDWWIPAATLRVLATISEDQQKQILKKLKATSDMRRGKTLSKNMDNLYDAFGQKLNP